MVKKYLSIWFDSNKWSDFDFEDTKTFIWLAFDVILMMVEDFKKSILLQYVSYIHNTYL